MFSRDYYKNNVLKLLSYADVKIGGNRSWDIKVVNDNFYKKVFEERTLGFGESYMDGWWDAESLDETIVRLLKSNVREKIKKNFVLIFKIIVAFLFNSNTYKKAFQIGEYHYDIGNDIYESMLDKRMVYTCGYWDKASNLEEAQEAKLDLVCKKLNLKKGQKILDIGCGWGSFAKYASEKYGVSVVGITVSTEQVKLAKELCKGHPVEIRFQDYREVNEKFDHIVSLGMFEHVGYKNYKNYMDMVSRNLKEEGLFILHTVGRNSSVIIAESWIDKYIFPGAMIPSIKQIGSAIEKKFVMEDWHNFGADYDKTLMAWFDNFDKNWYKFESRYGKKFYRMWKYYLLSFAGAFRARHLHLWQIVLSKKGVIGGHKRIC